MSTIFLRFDSESTARAVLRQWGAGGNAWPAYIGGAAVDVVGAIWAPTGNVYQTPDGPEPEMAPIPGYHVNLSSSVYELQQYEIEAPAMPVRIFAGSDAVEPPRVPAEVARWQAKLVLMRAPAEGGSLWDQLLQLRATMPDGESAVLLDAALHETLNWRRASPMVEQMAVLLGLTSEQIDAMFIDAARLEL